MARRATSDNERDTAVAEDPRPDPKTSRLRRAAKPVVSAVSVRRQTPEKERQLEAAIDLFLAEMVRQHFERQ